MRTDFESTQAVEVCGPGDTYNETTFVIGLHCTAPSFSGCFNPMTGYGEPPSGPEFELTTITLSVPHVNYKGEVLKTESLELDYHQFPCRGRDRRSREADRRSDGRGGRERGVLSGYH